jgi:hypothetical protein
MLAPKPITSRAGLSVSLSFSFLDSLSSSFRIALVASAGSLVGLQAEAFVDCAAHATATEILLVAPANENTARAHLFIETRIFLR